MNTVPFCACDQRCKDLSSFLAVFYIAELMMGDEELNVETIDAQYEK